MTQEGSGLRGSGQVPEFLELLVPDGNLEDLLWRQTKSTMLPATLANATHYCPSRCGPRRRLSDWQAQLAIVVDDVGAKRNAPEVVPSLKVETRPGNEQWVYLVDDPGATLEAVQTLLNVLNHELELGDPNAYRPNQPMRLPGGKLPPGKTAAARLLPAEVGAEEVRVWTVQGLYHDFGCRRSMAERIAEAAARREARRGVLPGQYLSEALALTALLDPDMRRNEGWMTVVFALHHESNGGDEGRAPLHEWSSRGRTYDAVELDYQWDNLDGRDVDDPVTVGSMRHLARAVDKAAAEAIIEEHALLREAETHRTLGEMEAAEGVEGEPVQGRSPTDIGMAELLPRLVLTPKGVLDLDDDKDVVWSMEAMSKRHARYDTFGRGGGRQSFIKNHWAVDQHRLVSEYPTRLFDPRRPYGFVQIRVEATGVVGWVNGYRPRELGQREPQRGDELAVRKWLDFVAHVYPNDTEYALDWAASKVQHPERKQVALLSATSTTGTGRTSFASILGTILNSYAIVTMEAVMGDRSGFLQNLLVVVNEIEGGGAEASHFKRKAATMNRLNEVIEVGAGSQMIRKHYIDTFTAETFCSFLLNSNHPNALPITSTQRRISTTLGNPKRMPARQGAWGKRLIEEAGRADLDAIHRWLLVRDVEGFEFWEAHDGAKSELIAASRTPFDTTMFEVMELLGHPVVFTTSLMRKVLDCNALRLHESEAHIRVRGMGEQERERALNSWVQENSEAPRCLMHQKAKPKLMLAREVLLPRVLNGHSEAVAAHEDHEQMKRDTMAWVTRARKFIENKPTIVKPPEPPEEPEDEE